ncbi:hypothetical protein [Rhodococcus sp. MEB041]|uniref:hypothetical protein n=1 Tax=Rhodococcus sp. MEB041 TaxID=3040323 RepID=UPI00254FD821|nr:hypothetical protein [Rhodococcus sp. MEB041]
MTTPCHNCDRPTPDDSPICATCIGSLRNDLLGVPGLIADMTVTRGRLDRVSRNTNGGGRSSETMLPIRERIDKSAPAGQPNGEVQPVTRPLDALVTQLGLTARLIADHAKIDLEEILGSAGLHQLAVNLRGGRIDPELPPRTDPTLLTTEAVLDVEEAAVWLAHNPRLLTAYPDAAALFDEVTDVIAMARIAIDRLPELSYKGTCDYTAWTGGTETTCGADLYVERGDDFARCGKCGAHYDVRELNRQIQARMHDMNYTATELASLLTELGHRLPSNTLRSWAHRRELTPRGWKHRGRITSTWIHRNDPPVYRLGDVLDLVETRRQSNLTGQGL